MGGVGGWLDHWQALKLRTTTQVHRLRDLRIVEAPHEPVDKANSENSARRGQKKMKMFAAPAVGSARVPERLSPIFHFPMVLRPEIPLAISCDEIEDDKYQEKL